MLRVHLDFSAFIVLIDSLLDHAAAIQKWNGAKTKKFLNFLTSTEVLHFFAVYLQTGSQLLGLFSDVR